MYFPIIMIFQIVKSLFFENKNLEMRLSCIEKKVTIIIEMKEGGMNEICKCLLDVD